jgi:hypothetical protein
MLLTVTRRSQPRFFVLQAARLPLQRRWFHVS